MRVIHVLFFLHVLGCQSSTVNKPCVDNDNTGIDQFYKSNQVYREGNGALLLTRFSSIEEFKAVVQVQYVSNSRSGMNYNDCIYYAQKEGEDKFILMNNRESMVKLLGDCQKAINLINLDYKDLDKKVKENKAYLNEAFQIYNNGCSEVGIRQEKN